MAMCVLAFVIMTSVVAISISVRELDGARMASAAAQVMQNEVERLRLLSWTGIEALPATENVALGSEITSATAVRNRMTLRRAVADVSGTGSPARMKQITLTVRWTAVNGTTHERTFRMLYGKNGLYDYYYSSALS